MLDSALLQEIIGGHDKRDSTSIPEGPRPMAAAAREGLKRDLKGLKVGLIKELGGDGYQPGVEARFNEAVDKLKEMGAEVVEVSVPHIGYSLGASTSSCRPRSAPTWPATTACATACA